MNAQTTRAPKVNWVTVKSARLSCSNVGGVISPRFNRTRDEVTPPTLGTIAAPCT